MLNLYYPYFLVFLTGLLGIWKAVPVGFVFGLHPFSVWLFTVLGASLAALVIYFFGNKIRSYIDKRRKPARSQKKQLKVKRLFDKYGPAGLGFLGCLLLGPNMTLLLGLVIVKEPRKLLVWTLAGIFTWTLALCLVAVLSLDLFNQLTGAGL